jgi:serine/threonine protein kinase/tetratricopeptide (TPR) repeat protein
VAGGAGFDTGDDDLSGAPSYPTLPTLSIYDPAGGTDSLAEGGRRPAAREQPPTGLPGYDLLGLIGRGAMGLVYQARHQGLNRLVALKVLRAPLAGGEGRARFRAEAEALARLHHPNIVQVYDAGEHQGQPYFTMEYVRGGSLDRKVRGNPLPAEPAARLVRKLALAMQVAHDSGIVHRDLKPANVLLQDLTAETAEDAEASQRSRGGPPSNPSGPSAVSASSAVNWIPKITDFGLAKHQGEACGQTQDGVLMGTPSYMAPEQADGLTHDVGPAADIWALGAILYELLTGRPPFKGDTVGATLEQVRSLDPVPPRRLQPNCPRDLNTICLKCLEKDPARRYPSAWALAEDLRRYLAGEPTAVRPPGRLVRLLKWSRRHPSQALLTLVLLLAAAGAALAVRWHIDELDRGIHEARSQERKADAAARRSDTKAGCEKWLRQAQQALGRPDPEDWRAGRDLCEQVLDRLSHLETRGDEELTRLRQEAGRLRDEAAGLIRRAEDQARARRDFDTFFRLRDDAFFLLHRDLVGNSDADPADSLRASHNALALFGWPARLPDPEALPDYSRSEREQLRSGLAEVLLLLAEATARSGRPDEALRLLDQAGALVPAGQAARRRARYQALAGEPAAAVPETAPQTALDWFLSGYDRLVQAGDAVGAVRDLGQAIERDRGLFWAYFLRAQAWHRLRQADAARLDLDACTKLRPQFAWSYLQRGFLWGQTGDAAAAERDFARARELARAASDDVALYVLHVNRGVLALSAGSPKDPAGFLRCVAAVRELRHAVAMAGGRYHAYLDLAEAYTRLGWPDGAAAVLDQAVGLAPREPVPYRERAEARLRRGQDRSALADLDEADRMYAARGPSPDADTRARHAEVRRRRAEVLYRLGRHPQAVQACRAALALDGADAHTHHLLGRALLALGSHQEALDALDRCAALSPRPDVEVFLDRARARVGLKQFGVLPEEYTRALAVRASAELYAARGWAWLVAEAQGPARADFQAALRINPDYADARVGLASVLALSGDHRQAAREVDDALRKDRQPSARLLYKAARVFAQAAAAAAASPETNVRNWGPAVYARRSVALLERALQAEPPQRRELFWRLQVAADAALQPVTGTPEFARLAARYGR